MRTSQDMELKSNQAEVWKTFILALLPKRSLYEFMWASNSL